MKAAVLAKGYDKSLSAYRADPKGRPARPPGVSTASV